MRQAWKSGSLPGLLLVPGADQQQHELRHPLRDRAQQRPVGAVAEVAERDRDDGLARRRRREGVGGERDEQRLAALLARDLAERVGDDDRHRGAHARGQVQLLQPARWRGVAS